MGRKPTNPESVTRLRKRKQRSRTIYYYYDAGGTPRKEIPLGSDYGRAIMEYAKLEKSRTSSAIAQAFITFAYVADKYIHEVVPTKSAATQKDNARELKQLLKFFDDPMTTSMLRGRFDAAREAAGVEKADFQMRDLRAKAGTDKAESSGDILQARDQLGHTTVVMTENYIRKRIGKKVTPTK